MLGLELAPPNVSHPNPDTEPNPNPGQMWKTELGGRFVDAPRLGCVCARAREEVAEGAEGAGGAEDAEGEEGEEEEDDDDEDDDDDDDRDHDHDHDHLVNIIARGYKRILAQLFRFWAAAHGHDGDGDGDDGDGDGDGDGHDDNQAELVLGLRRGAMRRRRLRRDAKEEEADGGGGGGNGGGGGGGGGHARCESVTLMGELPRSLPLARRRAALVYLGEYRWSRVLNGRPAFVHTADYRRVLWWCDGFWHAGAAVDAGLPCAVLIARDDGHARAPEEITALWEAAGDGGCWVEASLLLCALTEDVQLQYGWRWQCPFPPLRVLWLLLFLWLLCSPELLDTIGWYDGRWYDDQ